MNYNLFLAPLLVSFAIAVAVLVAIILWSKKKPLLDGRIESRHVHQKGISRFGGVAIIIAFVATILIDKKLVVDSPLMGLLIAVVAILFFGVLDDLKQISWKAQFLFQIGLVVLVYSMGIRLEFISNPFGGIFLLQGVIGTIFCIVISIIWVVLLTNAINWVDGLDGVAGGITLIGGLSIFFLSLRPEVNQPPIAIIAATLVGAMLAFLLFNFFPSKIIAGTSGSIFMGFVLSILAIFAGAKIATTLLVMAVPIIDALWVIGERWHAGVSIFSGDRRHLHFRLLELGWSVRKICFFYYAITAVVALVALNTHALGKFATFVVLTVCMVAFFVAIRGKIGIKNMNEAQ
jgi:UDP-GlcNAc:undecaprenyl-phosphate GlcNAc-1-phosphate transferase